MENPKSKISFTSWNETVSIEKPNSDLNMEEFYDMCKQLALGAGFDSKTVNEYF